MAHPPDLRGLCETSLDYWREIGQIRNTSEFFGLTKNYANSAVSFEEKIKVLGMCVSTGHGKRAQFISYEMCQMAREFIMNESRRRLLLHRLRRHVQQIRRGTKLVDVRINLRVLLALLGSHHGCKALASDYFVAKPDRNLWMLACFMTIRTKSAHRVLKKLAGLAKDPTSLLMIGMSLAVGRVPKGVELLHRQPERDGLESHHRIRIAFVLACCGDELGNKIMDEALRAEITEGEASMLLHLFHYPWTAAGDFRERLSLLLRKSEERTLKQFDKKTYEDARSPRNP